MPRHGWPAACACMRRLLEKSTNRVLEEIVDTIFCPTTGAFVHTMVTGYRVLMTTL